MCHRFACHQPTGAGAGSNKAQKAVVNKKKKGKGDDDDDDEVRASHAMVVLSTPDQSRCDFAHNDRRARWLKRSS